MKYPFILKNNNGMFCSQIPRTLNEDNEFNRDTKILRWSKENNISAAIIRPDQHIYGSVGNENIVNDIDKLVNKLKSEIL